MIATATPPMLRSPAEAEASFGIQAWGEGFFGVNEKGHLSIRPCLDKGGEIDLHKVADRLSAMGVALPVTLRFPEILRTRAQQLSEAFFRAMDETKYGGGFQGVFPIKVNQIRQVVEGILGQDPTSSFGLEAGSKPELVAAIPYLTNEKRLLLCNGYKNAEMISLLLAIQRLGRNVVPVVEKRNEFNTLLEEAARHDSTPRFGMRVRLSAIGAGQWAESSGDDSKFGISMPDLLQHVEHLESLGMYDALCLLHFHLGSQIDDIQALKMAVREITRIYVGLHKRGHHISYLDVGGGLGINYEGAPLGAGKGGVSYSMQEYANAIVYAVKEVCDAEKVPAPTIVTENGRALCAHHALLVVEAVSATSKPSAKADLLPGVEHHEVVHRLHGMLRDLRLGNGQVMSLGRLLEAFHDAVEERRNAETLFAYGYISLAEKAYAERLYWTLCTTINDHVHDAKPERVPAELRRLDEQLVDQVLCDFSVFQSLTDYWSIGQRFPIAPLHRLNEVPTRRCRLDDLTCDSYGTISQFISHGQADNYLNLHPIREGEPYKLGIFLTGAYQDSLSDAHNLFGAVNEARVVCDDSDPEGFRIDEVVRGGSVRTMLERVRYDSSVLESALDALVDSGVQAGKVSPTEGSAVTRLYRAMMDDQTYLRSAL